ncbi:MAG TPA: aminoglycoside phosphotransferase family protein [Candidatus Cybelea sp.]|nr:aminoglycoside phosphotransferase family protein [Candidatus Cybelea sp.]
MTTDPLPAGIDAERLTLALRRCGVLDDGRVRDIAVANSFPTILSQIVRLRLTYNGPAPRAPASLILKTGHPQRAVTSWNSGQREVAFYTQAAPATPAGLLLRCFGAEWDAGTNAWHLLLEDLTDSHHIATTWPLPPPDGQCESMVRTLARFHAAWWDDPRLGASVGAWFDDAATAEQMRGLAAQFGRFVDLVGDRLSSERRALYERLIDAAPRLLERYRSRRHATIVHGDAHVWNYLMPNPGGAGGVRLFDWDAWHIDTASDDLAYMMATHWYPERRSRLEKPLLDLYHREIMAHGVAGYGRQALQDDYRLSTLWLMTRPVGQAVNNLPPVIWWNNLERIMLAVDDLGCRELLG